jgi:hypothetical protein
VNKKDGVVVNNSQFIIDNCSGGSANDGSSASLGDDLLYHIPVFLTILNLPSFVNQVTNQKQKKKRLLLKSYITSMILLAVTFVTVYL